MLGFLDGCNLKEVKLYGNDTEIECHKKHRI